MATHYTESQFKNIFWRYNDHIYFKRRGIFTIPFMVIMFSKRQEDKSFVMECKKIVKITIENMWTLM